MDEVLRLLRENNMMLKRVVSFIDRVEANDDMRQFFINVAADIFVEGLDTSVKKNIREQFKL